MASGSSDTQIFIVRDDLLGDVMKLVAGCGEQLELQTAETAAAGHTGAASSPNNKIAIAGSVAGGVTLLIIVAFLLWWQRRRHTMRGVRPLSEISDLHSVVLPHEAYLIEPFSPLAPSSVPISNISGISAIHMSDDVAETSKPKMSASSAPSREPRQSSSSREPETYERLRRWLSQLKTENARPATRIQAAKVVPA